ncbi:MAG: ABC transporter permease, partial [Bacteroidota bacterium]
MIKNFFTISLRNITRQPGYAILNILGLTLGIACTLFILLYITEETRFDKHHIKGDRIYRIGSDITEPDDNYRLASTQPPLAFQLQKEFPEVEQYVRIANYPDVRLEKGNEFFMVEKGFTVDSTIFDVFTFDMVYGEPGGLDEPNTMMLCESSAKIIFGDEDPVGKGLIAPSGNEFKVTGVYKDWPSHSHFIPEVMFSSTNQEDWRNLGPDTWGEFWLYSYVLLKENHDTEAFIEKLQTIIDQHVAPIFDPFEMTVAYKALNVQDIHLHSTFLGEPEPVGNIAFLYIFGAIGLFMMLIACINYMNLSTSQATKRAMEVGVRKVLGSGRWQLVLQFLTESILFTLVAITLSYILVLLLLPIFNTSFGITLSRDLLWTPQVILGALGIILVTGILGGSYPALYLSGFRPVKVLKGSLAKGTGNPKLRISLVTLQFAITIFMIIGTGIIYDQMNYLSGKHLGFDKDQIMHFEIPGEEDQEKFPVLRDRLVQDPRIESVSSASSTPGGGNGKNLMSVEDSQGVMDEYAVDMYSVDFDYFPSMGIKFVKGRNFDLSFSTDSTQAVIVNEAMVKRMGWTEPIGKKFSRADPENPRTRRVIGVVRDFHQQSLYEQISAIAFLPNESNSQVHLRFKLDKTSELGEVISFAQNEWNEVYPNKPFEYDFLDESFMELYEEDQ